jgi:uncharacterized RDD family membrane protein YckC
MVPNHLAALSGWDAGATPMSEIAGAHLFPGQPLDAMVSLDTPERIVFDHPLGGPFRRFAAYLIDLSIMASLALAALLLSLVVAFGTSSGLGLAFVAYFLLAWGYGTFWEGLFNGQTPGKRALGLRVVTQRGVPITAVQALLRNLVGTVDGMLPFFFLVGLSSMLLTRKFQRLGDLAAATMVVVEERRSRLGLIRIQAQEPRVQAILDRLPLRVAAGSSLARALSDYVRRRHRFGRGLREELAEPLARPLRARFGLSTEEPADAVLCALYHRVFLGE